MPRSEVFEKYSKIVDAYKDMILDAEKYIYANPELGYKEFKTSAYLQEKFEALGYELKLAGNIPGFYTDIYTGRPGPTLLIFGELDAVICREHEFSDKETGAVHSCGHCCQTSALLGIAAALKTEGALDGLCGTIRLCAVPAEELLDVEYRQELQKKGIIKYMGGKIEFLYRGYFDDCDLSFMVHTGGGKPFSLHNTASTNGMITKDIKIIGKAAHSGSAPWLGINALYAANIALNAINALRETFYDDDKTRIHSIILKGGQMVNATPSEVVIQTQIRATSNAALKKMSEKVNRAYAGAAASLGAKCEIYDRPGYTPRVADKTMIEVCRKVMADCTDDYTVSDKVGGGCSDMGDIMSLMPGIHPGVSGAVGGSHSKDYYIVNPESATVFSAKFQLCFIHELLSNDAAEAKRVIANFKPTYKTREEYFEVVDSFHKDHPNAVQYNEDGTVTLDF